jgi:replicative DNA helicase
MAFNTMELERALLKTLLSGVMSCRLWMPQAKAEWFTSPARRFVFDVIFRTFRDSKSVTTESLYAYEVDARVPDEDRKTHLTEWRLIDGFVVTESMEAVVDKLREAAVGRTMSACIEDVIEKLESGDFQDAVSLFKSTSVKLTAGAGRDRPLVDITDWERRLEVVRDKQRNPGQYLGMKTGFKTFDKRTGGLFRKELTVIAGVTGLGKSTIVKQLARSLIVNGWNVLLVCNEESQEQVEAKLDAGFTELPYLDFKLAKLSEDDIEKWKEMMETKLRKSGVGKLFVKEVPAFTDVSLVESAYRELEAKGIRVHVIIIDHLPHIVPIEKGWSENDERGKAAADCKQLSKDLDVALVVPTQAATEVEEKQSKGKRAGKLDVYGSKAQIHVANTFIIITDKGKVPDKNLEDWQQDVNWLCDVKKNRDGPPFCFKARHYVQYGKVEEVFDDKDGSGEHAAGEDEAAEAAKLAEEAGVESVVVPVVPEVASVVPEIQKQEETLPEQVAEPPMVSLSPIRGDDVAAEAAKLAEEADGLIAGMTGSSDVQTVEDAKPLDSPRIRLPGMGAKKTWKKPVGN